MIPHDAEAESAVIGSCLLSGAAIETSAGLLFPGDFHMPSDGHMFAAITELWREGGQVDYVTVGDRMKVRGTKRETTDSDMLSMMANVPALSSIHRYCEIVGRHAYGRNALREALAGTVGHPRSTAARLASVVRWA